MHIRQLGNILLQTREIGLPYKSIVVQEDEPIAFDLFHTPVARMTEPLLGLHHIAEGQVWMCCRKGLTDSGRGVGAVIIYEQQLPFSRIRIVCQPVKGFA